MLKILPKKAIERNCVLQKRNINLWYLVDKFEHASVENETSDTKIQLLGAPSLKSAIREYRGKRQKWNKCK